MIVSSEDREIEKLEEKIRILQTRKEIQKEEREQKLSQENEWKIILPPKKEDGTRGNYSIGHLLEFKDSVKIANGRIDNFLENILSLYHGKEIDKIITGEGYSFITKLIISYQTFALSTFLDRPQLGKVIQFDWQHRHRNLNYRANAIGFNIIHNSEEKIVPIYLIGGDSFLIETDIDELVKGNIERYNRENKV